MLSQLHYSKALTFTDPRHTLSLNTSSAQTRLIPIGPNKWATVAHISNFDSTMIHKKIITQ